jgi:ABC-type transport system involved in multi-copper enzyme maturation permease subunit
MSPDTSKPAILGPVFRWELIRVSRRGYWHLCRFLFAATLLLYVYFKAGNRQLRVTELSEFTAWLVGIYAVVQYLAVIIFTPMLTCGTILEERNQRTLPLLLASLLHPSEVVQGKLFGRLLGLFTIVLTGIPILALLQFLGGIDFVLLLKETTTTLLLLLVLSMNGIYQSSQARSMGGAVMRTYAQTALHYLWAWAILLPPALIAFHTLHTSIYSFLASGGHFLACAFAMIGLRRLSKTLPELALQSAASQLQLIDSVNVWTDVSQWLWRMKSALGNAPREAWEYRFQTQLVRDMEQDGDVAIRHYRVPEVGDRPLVWKDTWFPLDRRLLWLLTVGSILLGCFTIGFYMVAVSPSNQSPEVMRIFHFSAYAVIMSMMVVLILRATSTLAKERLQTTLDDLLLLPWSCRELLWEKWCGVFWRYRILLCIVFVVILPIHAMARSGNALWLLPVLAAQLSVLVSLSLLVTLLCQLRPVLARLLVLLIVGVSLTTLPWIQEKIWHRSTAVALPANRAQSVRLHRSVMDIERKDVIFFDSNRQLPHPLQLQWLHIAQVCRNVCCPLEAWHDLLTQQEYHLWQPATVPMREAMRIGSPWHVHAMTTITLTSLSAALFGLSVLQLRRWRG